MPRTKIIPIIGRTSWARMFMLMCLLIATILCFASVGYNLGRAMGSMGDTSAITAGDLDVPQQKLESNLKGVTEIITTSSTTDTDNEDTSENIIFNELSQIGTKNRSDFQTDTKNAPSCSTAIDAASISYTLATQLSENRLWMIKHHCQRWGGSQPISIAVFTDRTSANVTAQLVDEGCSEDQLTVQTISKTRYDPSGTEYPVNVLRNMAIAVKTTHFVYADVDFWPSTDLSTLLHKEEIKQRLVSDPKQAVVVPAFMLHGFCSKSTPSKKCTKKNLKHIPFNKTTLMSLYKEERVTSFNPGSPGGHSSTDYEAWTKHQKTGSLLDISCIKGSGTRYEPYLVVRYCSQLPPFQEGFTGFGKNKITWVMQLRRAGYTFSQLGGGFLVHYPHPLSESKLEWTKTSMKNTKKLLEQSGDLESSKRASVDALYKKFQRWLSETYTNEPATPLCKETETQI